MMPQSLGDSSQWCSSGYCERIICLWSPFVGRGWWHELEDEQELLFAAGGRIIEVPLADAGEATAAAVGEGYRPVLFVPNPLDWPRVYDTLGPYRAYARLLVWTHDDDAMRDLLHFPSAEVQEVARARGALVVPNAAYGRNLDLLLQVSLGDFIAESVSEGQQTASTFTYCSRLNPFRIIELNITRNVTRATLKQFYLSDEDNREPCILPVRAGDGLLTFDSRGHCDLSLEQHPLPLIVKALRPALWRVESLWRTLMDRLRGMALGSAGGSFLSALQQILIINATPPDGAWLTPRLRTRGLPMRGSGQAAPSPYPSPVLIAVDGLVPAAHGRRPNLRLAVRWLPETAKPQRPPEVQVFWVDARIEARWFGDGCQAIAVRGVPGLDCELIWHWSPENAKLRIWLSPTGIATNSPAA